MVIDLKTVFRKFFTAFVCPFSIGTLALQKKCKNSSGNALFVLLNLKKKITTHLAGQTYVWHGCKWNFAYICGPLKSKVSILGFR